MCPPDPVATKDPPGADADPGVDAPGDAGADSAEPGEAYPSEPVAIEHVGEGDSTRGESVGAGTTGYAASHMSPAGASAAECPRSNVDSPPAG
jgi:hypothetical protein